MNLEPNRTERISKGLKESDVNVKVQITKENVGIVKLDLPNEL